MFRIAEGLKSLFERRYETFNLVFKLLSEKHRFVTILETGTLRIPNDIPNGSSTLVFSRFLEKVGGKLITIDHHAAAIEVSKSVTGNSKNIEFIHSDSIEYLRSLSQKEIGKIDCWYLDSEDLDERWPIRSMSHHLSELLAVWPYINDQAIIFCDDCNLVKNGISLSKAGYIKPFLLSNGWKMLTEETSYQWIFVKN